MVVFALVWDKAEFSSPTAKIDYLEFLFAEAKQERKARREERKRRGKKGNKILLIFTFNA